MTVLLSKVVSMVRIPPESRRVVVLVNPKAGPRAALPWAERLIVQLSAAGFVPQMFTDLAAATDQANRWFADGELRTLVGAGGDGTAAELVNRTVPGLPITLLPTGNSNLLARYLGLSREPDLLCRAIIRGVAARLDAASANGRIFLLMAGCGFDAEVVRRVHANRTGHISHFSYLKPIAQAGWRYPFPEIRVNWQPNVGHAVDVSVRWLLAFNLPCYGGGFRIAPQADGSDGLLDVCSFDRGGFWAGLKLASAVLLQQHHRLKDWKSWQAGRLRLTADAEVPYQLDGDPGGVLPLDIEVLPSRLTLVVPEGLVVSG